MCVCFLLYCYEFSFHQVSYSTYFKEYLSVRKLHSSRYFVEKSGKVSFIHFNCFKHSNWAIPRVRITSWIL